MRQEERLGQGVTQTKTKGAREWREERRMKILEMRGNTQAAWLSHPVTKGFPQVGVKPLALHL